MIGISSRAFTFSHSGCDRPYIAQRVSWTQTFPSSTSFDSEKNMELNMAYYNCYKKSECSAGDTYHVLLKVLFEHVIEHIFYWGHCSLYFFLLIHFLTIVIFNYCI